jgi:beta-lactamase regulating signal transducer with metallopeptidase domain
MTGTPAVSPVTLSWQAWTLLGWLAGVGVYLGYVLFACLSLWILRLRASRITDTASLMLLHEACDALDFRRPVELLGCPRRAMPMTWGIFRTWILLPCESSDWTPEQRRAVLLHELAHARRRDCQTQLLVQFACALHWFNPLVWFAQRRM